MNKHIEYQAVCLNGIIKAGDEIMTSPLTDYPAMRGRVLFINPMGSELNYNLINRNNPVKPSSGSNQCAVILERK